MAADTVFLNGHIATMAQNGSPYGAIQDAALAVTEGRIAWVGPRTGLARPTIGPDTLVHDMAGGWLTPGLIDCHTHLVFAGDRSAEFEARLGGIRYEDAAQAGSGILATVAATRAASETALLAGASTRLARLQQDGVTTVEIKSGYGLTLPDELKMLRVARALARAHDAGIRTSLLGAHAVPPEFAGRADDYIGHVIDDIMPAAMAENLIDAVDAFAEAIAFSRAQIGRLFTAARAHGLPVKLHADQLTDGGGAELAASFGALSADHLEYCSAAGARALAAAGTVAVLLPGAYATVGAAQPPPIGEFRAHHVRMAVATDCNPGSSPLNSLLLAMNLACCLFRLTPEEAVAGVTRHAAMALGLLDTLGTLEAGKQADLALWPLHHPRELAYWMGGMAPTLVMHAGRSLG